VAIHRDPFGARSLVNEKITSVVAGATKENFREEVLAGLSKSPRQLPYKFFYDQRGAQLFQEICDLPEYYITRTEIEILRLHGEDMAKALGPQIELIGLGTGAGTKTRILLEELHNPAVYVPIDISKEQLEKIVGSVSGNVSHPASPAGLRLIIWNHSSCHCRADSLLGASFTFQGRPLAILSPKSRVSFSRAWSTSLATVAVCSSALISRKIEMFSSALTTMPLA